jgi:hypothetical protein
MLHTTDTSILLLEVTTITSAMPRGRSFAAKAQAGNADALAARWLR